MAVVTFYDAIGGEYVEQNLTFRTAPSKLSIYSANIAFEPTRGLTVVQLTLLRCVPQRG